MTLPELLAARGIDRALVIDDGYDAAPTAADLAGDQGAWANFIADIALHHDAVERAFPGYADVPTDDLVHDDGFVRALWNARGSLDESAWQDLFGQYERDEGSDLAFLDELERRLRDLGLAVLRAGRQTRIEDPAVPLVFVDLFLGGAQDGDAMADSVARVRELLAGREDDSPLVVLMSRSDRLDLNRDGFRSATGLLGAMFRVSPKRSLVTDDGLARLLTRLAHHREDGRRLARFLNAWDRGLDAARTRFMDRLRRLDLPDYAQIRDLLVAYEGQPLGSYLLDVFDRVLQYEIEADRGTIAAASAVAEVDLSRYLAPHIAGSPDLQSLVHRTIYQNPARLEVPSTVSGVPLAFGDILAAPAGEGASGRRVLAVMTSACDLVRPGCRQVLMVAGSLRTLGPRDWSYGENGARTPVIIAAMQPGGEESRHWIAWDLRDIEAWSPEQVRTRLTADGGYRRVIRLREGLAIELQQKMLAGIGRVGQVAHLPGTFPIDVELHRVGADGGWAAIDLPALTRDGGTCFTGRKQDAGPNVRLVLTEAACDEIAGHIATIRADDVPQNARDALARLQSGPYLATMLEEGLDITSVRTRFERIRPPAQQGGQPAEGSIALISRNPTGAPQAQDRRQAVVALVLRDITDETAAGESTADGRAAPATTTTEVQE